MSAPTHDDITDHVWHEVVHLDCRWCVPAEVRARLDAQHRARHDEDGEDLAGGAVLTLAVSWALIVAGIATAVVALPVGGWHGLAVLLAAGGAALMWRACHVSALHVNPRAQRDHDARIARGGDR